MDALLGKKSVQITPTFRQKYYRGEQLKPAYLIQKEAETIFYGVNQASFHHSFQFSIESFQSTDRKLTKPLPLHH